MGKGILCLLLFTLALTGCGSSDSDPLATMVVPLPTATPALLRVPTFTQRMVSYEEIQQAVDHITGHDIDPSAPEVGLDGLADQRIMDKLRAYDRLLAGKKAVNWQGWVKSTYDFENTYNISIWMKDPPVPDGCCAQVTLWGITPEQKVALPLMEIGQHIQFSGTIDQAGSSGEVEMHDPTIIRLP